MKNYVITRDGDERIIAWHTTILKDEVGRITGTLSSGEDIADRKRADDKIKESEERLPQAHLKIFASGNWDLPRKQGDLR